MTPEPISTEELAGSTALLTGASGFLGRHLCRRLSQIGVRVNATSRAERAGEPAGPDSSWHRLDLSDAGAVAALVAELRPDLIVHLASLVKGGRDRSLVVPAFEANLCSTVHLLDAAAAAGVGRFLQLGSMEEPPLDRPPVPPGSPYGAAKSAATSYCRMYAELYGVEVVIARLFMVYGPGRQDEEKLVPYVIRSLLAGAAPRLSSGRRPVDWIYIDDAITGLVRLASAGGVAGKVVDLGSGRLVAVREVVERIYRALGRDQEPPFGTLPDRPGEEARVADIAATRALLGWAPEVELDEGLGRTIEWFRAHPAPHSRSSDGHTPR